MKGTYGVKVLELLEKFGPATIGELKQRAREQYPQLKTFQWIGRDLKKLYKNGKVIVVDDTWALDLLEEMERENFMFVP